MISGVLRYRMPIKHVIKLVSQLQLTSESINTWKVGVERALKNYLKDDEKVKYDESLAKLDNDVKGEASKEIGEGV